MFTVTVNSSIRFSVDKGGSILDAAARAGVVLPYSCKTGRCGICRCKVANGHSTAFQQEFALSDEKKSEGWILSCSRTIDSDVSIESEILTGHQIPPAKTIPCRIDSLDYVTSTILRVRLRLPPSLQMKFLPGQYVDIIGMNGIRRSYSIAGQDLNSGAIELHIRRLHGGVMSEYWFNGARVNDLLRLNGPLGTFFIRQTSGLDLYFLATGTGIAPIKTMLESLAGLTGKESPRSVTVFWGGRRREDFYFDVYGLPGSFEFHPVLSRPDADWCGARGYVQDVLLRRRLDLQNSVVYACGGNSMICDARLTLTRAGLPACSFISDAFLMSG